MDAQKEDHSDTEMLLFLMKHSRPDITNSFKDISKASDGSNHAAFRVLLHVIG